ncbi:MAG: acyl carrier protein [Chloroflexota bacterium]|nr:acyl carrier protein [Chloroflexota bacterium]
MSTVFERVKKVVVDQLGVDEEEVIAGASLTDDLKADSLDLMELVVALEEEFSDSKTKLEIPDEDIEQIATIQDIVDYIEAHAG